MTNNSSSDEMELNEFLKAAGQSLSDAQMSLSPDVDLPLNMMLSNAELEVKLLYHTDKSGVTKVKTFSVQDAQQGTINPNAVSTLRLNFAWSPGEGIVPVQQNETPAAGNVASPVKTPQQVIDEIKKQPAVTRLEKKTGDLNIKPSYVAEQQRWLVTLQDKSGKVVREMIVRDTVEGK